MICPVCAGQENELFDQDKRRKYFRCLNCTLVFVPRSEILPPDLEHARYEAHQNSEDDPYYLKYLSEISESTLKFLIPTDRGLDFGCGRTKLLANIYQEHQIEVDSYDLYFHPDQTVLQKKYDFIILSEVIEHLSDPMKVMRMLNEILNPDGKIFIKTKFYPEKSQDFSNWFYKRDLTHVEFFNDHSMKYLASKLNKKMQEIGSDLYLLT